MNNTKTLEELLFDLKHGDADARFTAVEQLGKKHSGRIEDNKAFLAVIKALDDEDHDVRNMATISLQFGFLSQETVMKYERKEFISVLRLFKGSSSSRKAAVGFFRNWQYLRDEMTPPLQEQKLKLPKIKPEKGRVRKMVHKR
ncbi:hypothetical protein KAW38_01530 [Candidatus Micrarchaeota archaeon]|nr:hypothetical protein [Candidatus Micrarchaeota archaeon]